MEDKEAGLELVLKDAAKERQNLVTALKSFAAENRLHPSVLQAADLALEEHLTNVLNYGYDRTGPHEVTVRLWISQGNFLIEVQDDGKAFNPLELPEVDTAVPLEERPIGGLGVHLIRQFMDEVSYRYERGRNILQMRKQLAPPGA